MEPNNQDNNQGNTQQENQDNTQQNTQQNNQQYTQQNSQQYSQANYQLKPFEYGYFSMVLHVVLLLFTCGIWWLIWVYRTTDYMNRLETEPKQSPVCQLLLNFVPFYSIYWTYKTADKIDKYARVNNVYSDITALSVILVIFVSVAAAIVMQLKINEIVQPVAPSNYSYAGASDGNNSQGAEANTGGYTYQSAADGSNATYQTSSVNVGPDIPSTGLNVLSFFFPIVGLILFVVWNSDYPIKAKNVGKWALIGFIVWVSLSIISTVLASCAAIMIGLHG